MIQFNGNSGCSIIQLNSDIIRKISSKQFYNNRLQLQMQKQMSFANKNLHAPKVLNSGYDTHNNFFFDMEYIKGNTLSYIFQKKSFSYCQDIINEIQTIHKVNIKKDISTDIFNKLKSTSATDEDIQLIMSCEWNVNVGYCHGDLTFENIIISKNKIYLIDFLDSFVDASIIDESKFLQDCFCYWSFRENYIPKRKLAKICDKFETKQHYCMLLMHLLRIIPYSSDNLKEKVLCMMNKVKHKINQF